MPDLLAEKASPTDTAPKYWLKVVRHGDFLGKPADEALELLRRFGRQLSRFSTRLADGQLLVAGFTSDASGPRRLPMANVPKKDWTAAQTAGVEALLAKGQSLLADLDKDLPEPAKGLSFKALVDPARVLSMVEPLLERAVQEGKIKATQVLKIEERILPLMKIADVGALSAVVAPDGLKMRITLRPNPSSLADLARLGADQPLAAAAFIDPDNLFNVAQVHVLPKPEETMDLLRRIPQTSILEGMLASAGLNLEKDILPTFARNSMVSANFVPLGEGGLPDFRIIGQVPDPAALLAIAPKMKQLAMQMGVFVNPSVEGNIPTFRISYFMFPDFGVHLTLVGDFLVIGTSRPQLVKTAERIRDVKAGKIPAYAIPPEAKRVWRIRFRGFNEQLQAFLQQSPLLAGRGVPPVHNLTVMDELGDMVLLTLIGKERFDITLDLPFGPKK